MTLKMVLESCESQIVVVFGLLIGSVIAAKVIRVLFPRRRATAVESVAAPAAAATAPADSGAVAAGSLKLAGVDEKTAAMIMAIVAHESGTPLEQLRFRSIRALD
jgi:hypothetical protein